MPETDPAALATLEDWLGHLEHQHDVAIDLGLERVRSVWEALGARRPGQRIVTVAGTNGKGSTVHALEALARAHGIRVATTTSPHLQRFNERIRINGTAVHDSEIVRAFERIEVARRRTRVSVTYFEVAILASLLIMAEAAPELAILEVGLGGRLDAVNIVDADLMVITPIALDHQAWLGDDREAIGVEKAGVLRPGRPCVITDPLPPASVLECAAALGAPTRCALAKRSTWAPMPTSARRARQFRGWRTRRFILGRSRALAAFEGLGFVLDSERARQAFSSLSVPGDAARRFRPPPIPSGCCAQPHAAEALARRIVDLGGVHLKVRRFADKDVKGCPAHGGSPRERHACADAGRARRAE